MFYKINGLFLQYLVIPYRIEFLPYQNENQIF